MLDYQLVRFYNPRIFGYTYCIFFLFYVVVFISS